MNMCDVFSIGRQSHFLQSSIVTSFIIDTLFFLYLFHENHYHNFPKGFNQKKVSLHLFPKAKTSLILVAFTLI